MDTSSMHLWLVLWKAYESVRSHAERHIAETGLGFSDFAVLELLNHKGPTPVNAIGQRVYLTSGSITAAIDRLERKGLVERVSDPEDRRTRVVHLKDEGRRLISGAFLRHQQVIETATAGLTLDERAQAIALLKKLGLRAQATLALGNDAD